MPMSGAYPAAAQPAGVGVGVGVGAAGAARAARAEEAQGTGRARLMSPGSSQSQSDGEGGRISRTTSLSTFQLPAEACAESRGPPGAGGAEAGEEAAGGEAGGEADEVPPWATSEVDALLAPGLLGPGCLGGPVVVLHAAWHSYYVAPVLKACEARLKKAGVAYDMLSVPGAGELAAAARAALKRQPSAIVAIAMLLPGQSDGYKQSCAGVSQALMRLNAQQDVPVISGLLMCRDEDQAHERTHGAENPGAAWAETALYMAKVHSGARQVDSRVAGA